MVLRTQEVKAVQIDNIPQGMKEQDHWLLWKVSTKPKADRDGQIYYDKIPCTIKGSRADYTDSKNWYSFKEVEKAYQTGKFSGLGFVMSDSHNVWTLDLDGITEHEILDGFKKVTYCEYSPSLEGVHAYFTADKPKDHAMKINHKGTDLELFSKNKFVTVTGDQLEQGDITDIDDCNKSVAYLIDTIFKPKNKQSKELSFVTDYSKRSEFKDNEILDKMFKSKNGDKIKALFDGDMSAYNDDPSSADMGLANYLAWWCNHDIEQMYNLFSQSKLWRADGSKRRTAEQYDDYVYNYVLKPAIDGVQGGYDPVASAETDFDILPEALTFKELKKELQKVRKDELMNMKMLWEENGSQGKQPTVIGTNRTALLLRKYVHFVLFDLKDGSRLAMYQTDEGIYTHNRLLMKRIISFLEPKHNETKADEVLYHIRNMATVKPLTQSKHLIPVQNGVYDTEKQILQPFSPDYVFTTKIATPYVKNSEKPIIEGWDIDDWLNEIADNDSEVVNLMWQVFNECLNPTYTRKKAIFLVGDGNNGKGSVQDLITHLVGRDNTAWLKVNEFDKDFRMGQLEGKTVVIGDDVPAHVYVDDSSNFNSVVTGDPVLVEFKRQDPYSAVFNCAVIQSTNAMPKFKNKTNGTIRRLLIVPFNAKFNDQNENFKIKHEYIKDERVLQYVLSKAIEMQFEKFDIPAASQKQLELFKEDNDPIYEFKVEVFDKWKVRIVTKNIVYAYYKEFCISNGYKPLSERKFHKDFKTYLENYWNPDAQKRVEVNKIMKSIEPNEDFPYFIDVPTGKQSLKCYENTQIKAV